MLETILTNIITLFLIISASTIIAIAITCTMLVTAALTSGIHVRDTAQKHINQARDIAFLILIICTIIGAMGTWVV